MTHALSTKEPLVTQVVPHLALTIQQPYAAAIALGLKTTENRAMGTKMRGPIAVHAGARWSTRGAQDDLIRRAFDCQAGELDRQGWLGQSPAFQMGAIVAVVDIDGCHPAVPGCCSDPWAMARYAGRQVNAHLQLTNPRVLAEPIPAVGRLGWWRLSAGQQRSIAVQIGAETAASA